MHISLFCLTFAVSNLNREIMNKREFLSNKLNDIISKENRLHSITQGNILLLLEIHLEDYYKLIYQKEVLKEILNETNDEDVQGFTEHLLSKIKEFRDDLVNQPLIGQSCSLGFNIAMLWRNETKRELIKFFELTLS